MVERWYDFHGFGCHLGNVGLVYLTKLWFAMADGVARAGSPLDLDFNNSRQAESLRAGGHNPCGTLGLPDGLFRN